MQIKPNAPASLKLARDLETRPHDPLVRVAGQPRGAGVRFRRERPEAADHQRVGAWAAFAVALGIGLTAAAVIHARGRA